MAIENSVSSSAPIMGELKTYRPMTSKKVNVIMKNNAIDTKGSKSRCKKFKNKFHAPA